MEYTLLELINIIKEGEFYIPVKKHKLLKRVYLESSYIQFEFHPNIIHVGLGISADEKFIKCK